MAELKTSIILEAIDKMSAPLKKTRDALKKLGEQKQAIENFKKLKKRTSESSKKFEEATKDASRLARQFKSTAKPTKALTKEFNAAKRKAGELKRKLSEETQQLERLRRSLTKAGTNTRKLRDAQRKLTTESDRLNRKLGRLETKLKIFKGISKGLGKVGGALRVAGKGAVGAAASFGVLGFVFKRFFLDTAAEFEQFNTQLTTLFRGNVKEAQTARKWIENFAARTPFTIQQTMQAFIKLKSFGIDPMNGSLQAIADQSAALGAKQETLNGILLAVGQAWSKQKLQGEEALQLIERGVGVWDLLSKATGRSTKDLQEASSKGKLARKEITLLIDQMGKRSKGAALRSTKTWNGMVNLMGDQFSRFANRVLSHGVFDLLKGKLQAFLEKIEEMEKSGKLDEFAKNIGKNLTKAFEPAIEFAEKFLNALTQIADSLTLLALPLKVVANLYEGLSKIGSTSFADVERKIRGKEFGVDIPFNQVNQDGLGPRDPNRAPAAQPISPAVFEAAALQTPEFSPLSFKQPEANLLIEIKQTSDGGLAPASVKTKSAKGMKVRTGRGTAMAGVGTQ